MRIFGIPKVICGLKISWLERFIENYGQKLTRTL